MSRDADVGAADTLLPSDGQLEQRLGRYVLRARLGAGAMGVVHLAHDPQLDREVAIKVLHARHVLTPGAADRLLREAKAMARLRHANVVAVHDAGTDGERVFVVMELIGGTTLGELLRRRTPAEQADWRRWMPMLLDAGRGLAAAHAAGILHRDFKPDNVLVDDAGRVCVGDFGLADVAAGTVTTQRTQRDAPAPRAGALDETAVPTTDATEVPTQGPATGPDARLTTTGAVMGTPAYMAPEQLVGRTVDASADQFSCCVAMFEALAGRRPFEVDDPDEPGALDRLRAEILAGRMAALPATVPGWLADAVRRGLAADPAQRWPSIDALIAHIERRLHRRRAPWIAAGAAAVAAGGAAIASIAWPEASRPTPPAPTTIAALPSLGAPRLITAPPTTHGIDVAGDRLLVWSEHRASLRTLGAAGAASDERSFDPGDAAAIACAALDADGRALLVIAREDAAWGATWWSPTVHEPANVAGDPDGEVIGCAAGAAGAVGVIEARAGDVALRWFDDRGERWRLQLAGAYLGDHELALSPDRRRAALVDEGGPDRPARLGIVELGTGAVRWRLDWPWIHGVAWRDDHTLWFASGIHPGTLHALAVDDATPPRPFHERDETWLHELAFTAGGDLVALTNAETKAARVVTLASGALTELDPDHLFFGWTDAGDVALHDRTSNHTWRIDARTQRRVAGPSTSTEVGFAAWYTRAGDAAVAMRIEHDDLTCRMDGLSWTDGATRWTLADCTSGVRCAGDLRAPCVIVRSGETGPTTVRWFDAVTGTPGDAILELTLRSGANVDAALSPDGKRIAIADGSATVRVVTLGGAAPVVDELALAPTFRAQDVAVGDGDALYVAGGDEVAERYQILAIAGDTTAVVVSSPTTGFYALRLSPDGKSLAANTWDESRRVELIAID